MTRGPTTTVETMVAVLTAMGTHREIARKLDLNVKTVARIRRLETDAAKAVAKALEEGKL